MNLFLVVSDELKTYFWLHGMRCDLQQELREFPGSPTVRTPKISLLRARVLSLVRKLRSRKLCNQKQNRSQVYWEALLFRIFHYSGKHSFKMFLMDLHSGKSPSLVIIIG